MLPSLAFIWKVFVSLIAIVAGILALYFVCVSAVYLVILAVNLDVSWAKKHGRSAHSDAVANAIVGVLILIFLGAVFWVRH
jgi:hypothetical protein